MILAIVQARMASTRLPGKVAMPLGGATVLEQVLRRVGRSNRIDEVMVATTINKEDLAVVALCAANGYRVFCGSSNDVLDRYYQAARLIAPDHIVRITADCPLIDPSIIDDVLEEHLAGGWDYTSNTLMETYPDGEDVEVFSFRSLQTAWDHAKLASEREHVTPFIRKRGDLFRNKSIEHHPDLSMQRWTLDTPSDYAFLKAIFGKYEAGAEFGMEDVIQILDQEPALRELNSGIARNEGYQKSLQTDSEIGSTGVPGNNNVGDQ
jgi:spore coat polysaccharide biosynthesis protein SpsF (cytidylyltransferase family)